MNKYQWPASKLTEEEMALLFEQRQKSKQSICELLRRAVHISYSKEMKCKTIFKNDTE